MAGMFEITPDDGDNQNTGSSPFCLEGLMFDRRLEG